MQINQDSKAINIGTGSVILGNQIAR